LPTWLQKGVGFSSVVALKNKQFAVLERDNEAFFKVEPNCIYTLSLAERPEKKPTGKQVLNKFSGAE